MPLQEGIAAPDFRLLDDTGVARSLSDYRGQYVVLYFYPKDDTKGCTTEACNFRDDYSAYQNAGVTILGVSPDTVDSHRKFKKKYDLPFVLLADPERQVLNAYEVCGRKKFMGREYDGVLRTTYLIGPDGVVIKVFPEVRVADHSSEVLAAIPK